MSDTPPDTEAEQNEGGGALRRQLEAALAEAKELREENSSFKRREAFSQAGFDIESGPGKLLAQQYDGELDEGAIKAFADSFAEEYGIKLDQTEARPDPAVETQQRTDALRQQSRSDGAGQRLGLQEFFDLNGRDPQMAKQALESGQVDVPPHVAEQLAANGRGI